MFYYFYKITNLIDKKFYYGVHSTDNINDNYMGSGKYIKRAINKYGVSNFKKEILKYFNTREEMFKYEADIVNEALVLDENSYNLVTGGKGGWNFHPDILKEMRKKCLDTYYRNGSNKIVGEKLRTYYTVGHPEEASRLNKIRNEYLKKIYEDHPEYKLYVYKKVQKSLCDFWENIDYIDPSYRKNRGELVKNSEKYKVGIVKMAKTNSGYNNPDFKARWKNIYEKDRFIICELLKYSNLPDKFIFEFIFNKKIKIPHILAYYEYCNYLPVKISEESKQRFLNFNNSIHKDGISTKTIYTDITKYNIQFYFKDFFDELPKLIMYNSMFNISDSMLIQGDKDKHIVSFFKKIDYFELIGVIYNRRTINIDVELKRKTGTFLRTSTKTIFDIQFKKLNCILLDKELNEYEFNEHGELVQKGRFKLQIDGVEYSL